MRAQFRYVSLNRPPPKWTTGVTASAVVVVVDAMWYTVQSLSSHWRFNGLRQDNRFVLCNFLKVNSVLTLDLCLSRSFTLHCHKKRVHIYYLKLYAVILSVD